MPEIEQVETSAVETDTPPPAAPTAEEFAALKAQTEALQNSIAEHQRTAQFWYDKAQESGKPAKPAPVAEPESETDLLEIITTKGEKGLDALLEKRGFVRADKMEQAINSKAAQIAKENELIGRFPDLKKHDSEFFKTTAGHYGQLKASGVPDHMAMELAAERTELELIRTGKIKTPQEQAAEAKTQREQERRARIAAQSGDRGSRATQQEDDSDELTEEQKQVAVRMLAVDGVTPEEAIERYKARAKKGVAIKGGMR